MKKSGTKIAFDHSGSSFVSFLEEEGIREEAEAVAIKRVLAWQLSQEMLRQRITKQAMARDLKTSRSQLDRLLDPRNVSVSLDTLLRSQPASEQSDQFSRRNRADGEACGTAGTGQGIGRSGGI
jgi:hypothetical protein